MSNIAIKTLDIIISVEAQKLGAGYTNHSTPMPKLFEGDEGGNGYYQQPSIVDGTKLVYGKENFPLCPKVRAFVVAESDDIEAIMKESDHYQYFGPVPDHLELNP